MRKDASGSGNKKCKGAEAGMYFTCLEKSMGQGACNTVNKGKSGRKCSHIL